MFFSFCLLFFIFFFFFFFNDTATTEIYTLSLHDALPICPPARPRCRRRGPRPAPWADRKSTRLNSSHSSISYAVFCLKKKKQIPIQIHELRNKTAFVYGCARTLLDVGKILPVSTRK